MTYETIEQTLQENGIRFNREISIGIDGEKISGLEVECQPIMQDDFKKELERILFGLGAKIDRINNKSYLLITLK